MNAMLAKNLLLLRRQHDLSQEELAAKLKISRQAVSKWERAEAMPDIDKLLQLSELFKVTVDMLLGKVAMSPNYSHRT